MRLLLLVLLGLNLGACQKPAERQDVSAPTSDEKLVMVKQPAIRVYQAPDCAAGGWLQSLQDSAFPIELIPTQDLDLLREQMGLPFGLDACQLAEIEGFVIAGPVPVRDILRLLRERPKAIGLVVPGRPEGVSLPSSGPYKVWLVHKDGTQTLYAEYRSQLAMGKRSSQ